MCTFELELLHYVLERRYPGCDVFRLVGEGLRKPVVFFLDKVGL